MKPKYGLTLLLALTAASLCRSADYTVETFGSIPRICVDGKPVRARMFYGNVPGTHFDESESAPKTVKIKFTAAGDKTQVSLNFGAAIGRIEISEMKLADLQSGQISDAYDFSAPDAKIGSNWTVKALEAWRDLREGISQTPPDPKKYPKPPFSAKHENGKLVIEKESVDMSLKRNQSVIHDIERLNFLPPALKTAKGREYELSVKVATDKRGRCEISLFDGGEKLASNTAETFMSQEKFAKERGIDFVSFGMPAFWSDSPLYRKVADERFQAAIAANPDVRIIVRLGFEPPNEWLDAHPDDLMRSPDGTLIERMHVRFPTPSSEAYRRDAMEAARKFVEYVEKRYPDNIAGYHPSGGNSSEWFYGGSYEKGFHGYDKATLKAWRKWLAKKYRTDAALRKAWNNADASIETAAVPSKEERFGAECALLDLKTRRAAFDFNIFLQDEMTDFILLAARTIRQTAPAKRLSVIFYGYGIGFSTVPNGPAYSGHYGFKKLLASPDIDIFTAPIAYTERQLGGLKRTVSAAESVLLAGKIWLDEDDNRTWLAPKSGSPPYVLDSLQKSRAESVKVMQRNMANQTLRNIASWWMDLFGCGWFLDRQLWGVFDQFEKIEKHFLDNPTPFAPETAISYDETSLCTVAGKPSSARTCAQSVYHVNKFVAPTGTPFGQYLFDDVAFGRAKPKLHYIGGAYALTKKQRLALRAATEHTSCVFIWNAGYVDLDAGEFSTAAIAEATGFDVEPAGDTPALAIPTEDGKKLGIPKFGFDLKLNPLFSPIPAAGDRVLAKYPNGKPAMVLRTSGKRPQIYIGPTQLSPEVCRAIAKICGVHSYVDNEAVAFANGGYLLVYATKDGDHTVSLKTEADVEDALAGKKLGRFKTKTFPMKSGDVLLMKLSSK